MKIGFVHESSKNETVEWYTPPSIFELLVNAGIGYTVDNRGRYGN